VEVEVLKRESWSYSLEKRDSKYVLSVLCGGVGTYDVEVELSQPLAMACVSNKSELDSLANLIRKTPETYKHVGVLTELPAR
jgi:hypothetical protein